MKTILIAGGAGFIGSHLCERLLNEKNRIICLDNLFTGSKENIKHLFENENFVFLNHDIINKLSIDEPIHQIYNLACPASPEKYQLDPIYTLKINFIGVLNLLEFAREQKATILQSSTSEIYGEPQISPQTESYRGNVNTIGIRSCYDEGKRISETLMTDYSKQFGVDIRIVRIFNTYGPKMQKTDGRVITNFIYQALHNENITIYGNGSQTRSFCYIDDQIEGLIKLMNSNYKLPVNIGNTNEISIKELAIRIMNITNSKSQLLFKPLPDDDPTNRRPDISKAFEILDWKPTISLDEGIRKLLKTIHQ
jgi:UDP-glucuronate decarboxylase